MKTARLITATFAITALACSAWAQGSLTPPGAPVPSMKTLNQIEPRTPISSVPYTISEPGSYYLTTNLTSTTHGVVITASNVTLDLMGFTLSGDRGSSDYGVFLDGATNSTIQNVVVHNGIVRNFGFGVSAEYALNNRFERLISSSNYYRGVSLDGSSGQCNGNSIAHCTISGNGSYGIFLYGNAGQCDGNTIANCTISGNESYGIYLRGDSGQCDGNTIVHCTISGNQNVGIILYGNAGQCNGNTLANCTIRKNATRGIYLYSADGNRVEGNHISGQTGTTTYGIYSSSTTGNLIVRNTCVGQTNNFYIDSDDTYGPIVTSSGALSGTDPWANFSR